MTHCMPLSPPHERRHFGVKHVVLCTFLSCALGCGAPAFSATPSRGATAEPPTLIPFQSTDGRWGYLDRESRHVVIAPRFSDADLFKDGRGEVHIPNPDARSPTYEDANLTNWIDASGKDLFPAYFLDVSAVAAGDDPLPDLRQVETTDRQYGIVSLSSRQWVIPPQPAWKITVYARDRILVGGSYLQVGGQRCVPPQGMQITGIDFDDQVFHIAPLKGDPDDDHTFENGLSDWHGHVIVPPRYMDVSYDARSHRALATRFGSIATWMLNRGHLTLLQWLDPSLAPTTDLLDDHGKVVRSFDQRYTVDFSKRAGIGTYAPRDPKAADETRYFDLATGKDVPAEQADPHTGPWVFRTGNRYGVKRADGSVAIPATYLTLQFFNKDLLIANRDQRFGVINLRGETVVPFEYAAISNDGLGRLEAWNNQNDTAGVFDTQGRLAIPFERRNNNLVFSPDGLAEVHENGNHGIIDSHGDVVIPAIYKTLFNTRDLKETDQVYYTAENRDGRWGMLSAAGQVVIPFDYSYVSVDKKRFATGWVHIESINRQDSGLANIRTGVTIPPIYRNGVQVHDGFLIASRLESDGRYSYQMLDLHGQPLTDPSYTDMEVIQQHYVKAEKGRRVGVLDATGQVRVPIRYRYLWDAGQGFVRAETAPGRYVFVDFKGTEYRPQP